MAHLKILTVNQMKELITGIYTMDSPPTLMFFGEPGIGKTFGIVDVAKELDATYIPLSLGRLEPYDIKGIPDVSGDFTKWKLPFFWQTAIEEAKKGKKVIIHCDEATLASEDVQGAILDVVWQKTVDDVFLGDSVGFIFTGNMGGEDGTFARSFSSALTGGRGFIYGIRQPDIEDWLEYQKPMKEIEDFLMSYREKVFYVGPKKDSPFEPWTNPRGWSQLDNLCKALKFDPVEDTEKILGFARGILSPATVSLFTDFIGKNIINPQGLYDMKESAWKQYAKNANNPAKRKVALNDVLDIALPMGTVLATKEERQAVADKMSEFCDKLIAHETLIDIITGFGREFGKRQPMVYDLTKVKGMKLHKYFDDLIREARKG